MIRQISTQLHYNEAAGVAEVSSVFDTGYSTQRTIPINQPTFDYYRTIAQAVAGMAAQSGQILPANSPHYAEYTETGTMMALLMLHGEGIDMPERLKNADTFNRLVSDCVRHQSMDPFALSGVLSYNERNTPLAKWQSLVSAQAPAAISM